MANAQDQNLRWVVRLTPMPDSDIERLLQMPLGLDVWERKRDPDVLVVAAAEGQISELERRQLANVERLCTGDEFVSRFAHPARQADMIIGTRKNGSLLGRGMRARIARNRFA